MEETFGDYSKGFDVDTFLTSRFAAVPGQGTQEYESLLREFAMRNLHDFFRKKSLEESTDVDELKVLDYGCGPVIANVISAASLASEIVLAEYTEEGRTALRRWLDKDPFSFNWSPHFKYIVQTLEGKSLQEAEEREERLRRVVKAVVRCDVTQDRPIEEGYEGPYDVVICCLCLTDACKTKREYQIAVRKLAAITKPGGVLLLYTVESKDPDGSLNSYKIGRTIFQNLPLSQEFVLAALEQSEFSDITVERFAADPSVVKDACKGTAGAMFFTARKNLITDNNAVIMQRATA